MSGDEKTPSNFPHASSVGGRRTVTRRRWGRGQLSLLEHSLCPLDPEASLRLGLQHETSYFYYDKNGNRKTAKVKVLAPLGLSACDELYLWGLLALTLAQPEGEGELCATPYYCLRMLGVIAEGDARKWGGEGFGEFRQAVERLSAVKYVNERFYDPMRLEHRRVGFGFFSYNLPLELESSRAWTIAWDPIFFGFCKAVKGGLAFDLDTYRALDPASRRL